MTTELATRRCILVPIDLHGISREDCDGYAALSQQRAEAARARGAFTSIVPVTDVGG